MSGNRGMLNSEVTPMMFSALSTLGLVIVGVFYIFVIWVLWMVVKSLKGINVSLNEIARNGSNKL
jgi:hypothetical protein